VAIHPHRRNALLLLAADLLAVALVFNLVMFLRGVSTHPFVLPLAAPALVFVSSLYLIDGYGARADMLSLDYAALHLIASFFAALSTLLLTFAFIPGGFELQSSRAAIVLSFGIIGPASLAYRRLFYQKTVVSRTRRNIVYVGEKAEFDDFAAECTRMAVQLPLLHVDASNQYRSFESVLEAISTSQIQVEAIVMKETSREMPADIPTKLIQMYFDGIPTYTLELFNQVYWRKIPLYRINPIWLFQEGFRIAREPVFERIKRGSDVLLSTFGLLLSSPFIAVAALAIKLDDGGPVFFSQTRVGRHRIPFRLLKLRTMRQGDGTGELYTKPGDSRITRAGRMLRSARLDELPQLWNVLVGQMSLIGPRAEWDRLVAEYEAKIPSYHFRHLVKPGITGWAQVNYRYGAGVDDTLRKLEYDLYYIRNYSFMLDASIVLKTLHVMLLQKGH
jgi:exopolysaccharide biosynthesis polyprenyl glycosylphosphotransferase